MVFQVFPPVARCGQSPEFDLLLDPLALPVGDAMINAK